MNSIVSLDLQRLLDIIIEPDNPALCYSQYISNNINLALCTRNSLLPKLQTYCSNIIASYTKLTLLSPNATIITEYQDLLDILRSIYHYVKLPLKCSKCTNKWRNKSCVLCSYIIEFIKFIMIPYHDLIDCIVKLYTEMDNIKLCEYYCTIFREYIALLKYSHTTSTEYMTDKFTTIFTSTASILQQLSYSHSIPTDILSRPRDMVCSLKLHAILYLMRTIIAIMSESGLPHPYNYAYKPHQPSHTGCHILLRDSHDFNNTNLTISARIFQYSACMLNATTMFHNNFKYILHHHSIYNKYTYSKSTCLHFNIDAIEHINNHEQLYSIFLQYINFYISHLSHLSHIVHISDVATITSCPCLEISNTTHFRILHNITKITELCTNIQQLLQHTCVTNDEHSRDYIKTLFMESVLLIVQLAGGITIEDVEAKKNDNRCQCITIKYWTSEVFHILCNLNPNIGCTFTELNAE